jgi:hypothetical protein
MKKLVVVSLLLCLAFAPASATVFAQSGNNIVLIYPLFQDEITVTTEQELILGFGWAACTPGLVRSYITAAHYEWYLDSVLIVPDVDAAQYFGPIQPAGPVPWCLIGKGTSWKSYWTYSIGTLDSGTYVIRVISWLDHEVIDGSDIDGDGRLDHWGDTIWDGTVTVYVKDP